jgi:folate-binding protein YgfZ
MSTELQAALNSAAVIALPDRAFLRITGADASRWLNGMVTNSIKDLAPGEGNYNFLLNAQGRIQGDAWIYREPTEGDAAFLLETHAAQAETIRTLLDRFIIMDDVELADFDPGGESLGVAGPQAAAALAAIGIAADAANRLSKSETESGALLVLTRAKDHIELRGSAQAIAAARQSLAAQGLPELSAAAARQLRIVLGTPKFGTDIRDRDLPQETSQTHALHFNKGCYLGQEIVERIRSRGQVHRLFTRFELTGTLPTELPAPLEANGKPAGEITSAAEVDGKLLALGYARREALDLKQPLTFPGGAATPRA